MKRSFNPFSSLEREKGIEPSFLAWEASVLPLNHSRPSADMRQTSRSIALRDGLLKPGVHGFFANCNLANSGGNS